MISFLYLCNFFFSSDSDVEIIESNWSGESALLASEGTRRRLSGQSGSTSLASKRGMDEDFPVRMDIQVSLLRRGLDGDYPVCKVALVTAVEVGKVGVVRVEVQCSVEVQVKVLKKTNQITLWRY